MGIPITHVDYRFTLTSAQAEIFDEMLSSRLSIVSKDIMSYLREGKLEQAELLDKKWDNVSEIVNIISQGADVHQEVYGEGKTNNVTR